MLIVDPAAEIWWNTPALFISHIEVLDCESKGFGNRIHKGFIGSHVYNEFYQTHGNLVTGIDRPDDIADFDGGDYDVVIHLNLPLLTFGIVLKDPESFYTNNVVKTKRSFFDWCRETNTRLLYASSSAVDGNYWDNPYAMTKWINEQQSPPNSVGMRFTTVYGPNSLVKICCTVCWKIAPQLISQITNVTGFM